MILLQTAIKAAEHAISDRDPLDTRTLEIIVEAVFNVAVEGMARYRPQHDEDCAVYFCVHCGDRWTGIQHFAPPVDQPDKWVQHELQRKPCSCGLADLLALPVRQVQDKKELQSRSDQSCVPIADLRGDRSTGIAAYQEPCICVDPRPLVPGALCRRCHKPVQN